MGSKLGVVQILQCILHVIVANKLDDTSAVLEHVSIADIAGLAHVVLEVLPAAGGRQASDDAAVVRATCGRTRASRGTWGAGIARALLYLHAQLVAVKVVAIAALDRVLRVHRVVELDKGEWRSASILQVNVLDLAILVEQVLDVFVSDIRGQIALNGSR